VPGRARILDIEKPGVPLARQIVLDANILLRLSSGDARVRQFMGRVKEAYDNGYTRPLVCISTLEECYHKILVRSYLRDDRLNRRREEIARREGIKNPRQVGWQLLYKDRPTAIQRYTPKVAEFLRILTSIPVIIVEPEDLAAAEHGVGPIEARMRYYANESCLLGKDAWMVAQAERLGVYNIATLDPDLHRLGSEFTLYSIPRKELPARG